MLPFTPVDFFDVFARYNAAIWPAQLAAYALGAVAVALAWRGGPRADRLVAAILGVMWLWTGVGYHWLAFAPINAAAWAFGALFVVQAALLLHAGVLRQGLRFAFAAGPAATLGLTLIAYAALLYPLAGFASGHAYPRMPMFGVTPCPVTLFTFGLLLLARPPRYLVAIPLAWSLIGGTAAFLLQAPQDWPLLFGGPAAALVLWRRNRRLTPIPTPDADRSADR